MSVFHQPGDCGSIIVHLNLRGFPVANGGNATVRLLTGTLTVQDLHKPGILTLQGSTALLEALFFLLEGSHLGSGVQYQLCKVLQDPATLHLQAVQLGQQGFVFHDLASLRIYQLLKDAFDHLINFVQLHWVCLLPEFR